MANNLFVSYDLDAPGQNYSKVIRAIESLGPSVKVHESFYYVKSLFPADQAKKIVYAAMDGNDRVLVIEAMNLCGQNALPGAEIFIDRHWNT